jgi:hypothetical protein
LFCRAENLDAFFSEIGIEPGQGEAGPINRRFPNAPVEADLLTLQLELKRLGMPWKNASTVTTGTFIRCSLPELMV